MNLPKSSLRQYFELTIPSITNAIVRQVYATLNLKLRLYE